MKTKRWNDWKKMSYTKHGWIRFKRTGLNGKKWYKTDFGLYSPYDSKVYKWGRYNPKTGKIKLW